MKKYIKIICLVVISCICVLILRDLLYEEKSVLGTIEVKEDVVLVHINTHIMDSLQGKVLEVKDKELIEWGKNHNGEEVVATIRVTNTFFVKFFTVIDLTELSIPGGN